jgi:hypothetical protein
LSLDLAGDRGLATAGPRRIESGSPSPVRIVCARCHIVMEKLRALDTDGNGVVFSPGCVTGARNGDEKACWNALSRVGGIGVVRFPTLLDASGSIEAAWHASADELRGCGIGPSAASALIGGREETDSADELARVARAGSAARTWLDERYPDRLREIAQPPPVLCAHGAIEPHDRWTVGGTRRPCAEGSARHASEVACSPVAGCCLRGRAPDRCHGKSGNARSRRKDNGGPWVRSRRSLSARASGIGIEEAVERCAVDGLSARDEAGCGQLPAAHRDSAPERLAEDETNQSVIGCL